MTDLCIEFTDEEVSDFLNRIEVTHSSLNHEFLSCIVSGIIEHIPFQNVTMLTNEWKRPSNDMIKNDMINGIGGLCTVRNPFLHQFLLNLGFDVNFVSSTILEPDCHISLIVKIDNEEWWVDVGNGFPYLEPVRLGDTTTKENWFMSYKLSFENGRYHVWHKLNGKDWNINHHFSPSFVEFSVFDRMHELHYSVPGWGPFLTGLRINRFWENGAAVVRNDTIFSKNGFSFVTGTTSLRNWLNLWFKKPGFLDSIDLEEADKIWRREKARFDNANNS